MWVSISVSRLEWFYYKPKSICTALIGVSGIYFSLLWQAFSLHSHQGLETPRFSIERGVFQGDTLSPLIFLLAFNPIVEAINSVEPGFQLMLPSQSCNEASLPGINTYIYARWDEEGSDERPGWYLAKILSIDSMGLAVLKYRKGNLTEEVNLSSIKWTAAINGRGKWFLPLKMTNRKHLIVNSFFPPHPTE